MFQEDQFKMRSRLKERRHFLEKLRAIHSRFGTEVHVLEREKKSIHATREKEISLHMETKKKNNTD